MDLSQINNIILKKELHFQLVECFPFYGKLSNDGQKKFIQRISSFKKSKIFVYHFNAGIYKEFIENMIAASAIQLTWGLQDFKMKEHRIIAIFESEINTRLNIGKNIARESLATVLNFSWYQIVNDYTLHKRFKIIIDLWVVILMRMAHKNTMWDEFFIAYFKVWCDSARSYLYITDEYSTKNVLAYSDKFPIIIHQFFENTEEFMRYHPEIYEHTKKLLNLDLLEAKDHDFKYSYYLKKTMKSTSNNRVILFNVQDTIRKFGPVPKIIYYSIAMIPILIFVTGFLFRYTYMYWYIILGLIITILGTVGFCYHYFYVKRGISIKLFSLLTCIGIIPFVYSFLISFNYFIPIKRNTKLLESNKLSYVFKSIPNNSPLIIKNFHYDLLTGENKVGRINSFIAEGDLKGVINMLDDNDQIFVDSYTGIFGAEVYDGLRIFVVQKPNK